MHTALFALLIVLLAGPLQAQSRGDVDGDGRVDGLDALHALRIVAGRAAGDSAALARGDVHPFPGTEGRLMGDGRLTRSDALVLLRYQVGATSRGEATGEFERPAIDRLEPAHGAPGDPVRVVGTGFVPGRPEDNLVRFGDLPAAVLQATGTALTVTVPAGAVSAPVSVTGPGGTAATDFDFTIAVSRPLQLVPPAGMQATEFDLINQFLEDRVADASGGVSLPTATQGLTTHMAVPRDGSSRLLLAMDIVDDTNAGKVGAEPAAMDVTSTAHALVFQCPQLATGVPERARITMDLIRADALVAALVQVMETLYGEDVDVPDDPRYIEAYKEAVASVLDRLPPEAVADFEQADRDEAAGKPVVPPGPLRAKGSAGAQIAAPQARQEGDGSLGVTLFYPDADISSGEPTPVPALLQPVAIDGNPLDWIVHMSRVDDPERAFPRGWADVATFDPGTELYRDVNSPVSVAFLASSSFTGKLDWFGSMFSKAWDAGSGFVTEMSGAEGVLTPDNTLEVDLNQDGVYIVRCYSGIIFDLQFTGENDFIDTLPFGTNYWVGTLTLNALVAGSDLFAAMAGKSAISVLSGAGLDIHSALRKSLRSTLRKAVRVAIRKAPRGARSLTGRTDWFRTIGSLMHDFLYDFVGTLAGDLPGLAADAIDSGKMSAEAGQRLARNTGLWKQGVTTGLRFIGGAIDMGYKASMYASAGERAAVLLLGWHWTPVSPLETWLVVVGDPFNPRIRSFLPERAGAGRTVTIRGDRFSSDPADIQVFIGDFTVNTAAEVVEASPTRLVVRVPRMREGSTGNIIVRTPTGQAMSEGAFQMLRSPYLSRIEPEQGYIPNAAAFGGEGFPGTRLSSPARAAAASRRQDGHDVGMGSSRSCDRG